MTNTQLPAHLLALFQSNPEATAIGSNITANDAFAKIRYNGKKFKLIKADGEEINVPLIDINGVPTQALDVIVVGINEHKSHTVYAKAFDPKGDPEAPIWSSDDGTPVPEEHATKVVSDYRRWAVLIANNPTGGVFELRVSAGSITNGDRYVAALNNFGAPVASMVTRLTFDPAFDYPKLMFTPVSYITEEQTKVLGEALKDKNQISIALGQRKDNVALAAPQPIAAIAAPVEQPAVIETVKRTRKKAEPVTVPANAANPLAGFQANVVQMSPSASASTVVTPQQTSPDLDGLLSSIMNR